MMSAPSSSSVFSGEFAKDAETEFSRTVLVPIRDSRLELLELLRVSFCAFRGTGGTTSVAETPAATTAAVAVSVFVSVRSKTSAHAETRASLNTYAVSPTDAPHAIGTAIAPQSHAACIAATNSGPGTALTATRVPRRMLASTMFFFFLSLFSYPSVAVSFTAAAADRSLPATTSACVSNDPYVISSPSEVTTATASGLLSATSLKRCPSPFPENGLLSPPASDADDTQATLTVRAAKRTAGGTGGHRRDVHVARLALARASAANASIARRSSDEPSWWETTISRCDEKRRALLRDARPVQTAPCMQRSASPAVFDPGCSFRAPFHPHGTDTVDRPFFANDRKRVLRFSCTSLWFQARAIHAALRSAHPRIAAVASIVTMSLPLSMYQSTMAGSFASRGVENRVGIAAHAPTFTQQMTHQFMAPAKKEFSAKAFFTDLAIVRARRRFNPFHCAVLRRRRTRVR